MIMRKESEPMSEGRFVGVRRASDEDELRTGKRYDDNITPEMVAIIEDYSRKLGKLVRQRDGAPTAEEFEESKRLASEMYRTLKKADPLLLD